MQDNEKKAIFVAKKMFAQLIYDFQSLEGMPFTFPEVTTFLQGITVGGHKISDQDKLRQQQLGWQRLIALVEQERFTLSEKTACELEGIHWEGNKRTGTLMMNGLFLSNGILPCSVPAKRLQEYNTLLVNFYKTGGYRPLIDFYKHCHQTIYADWKTAFPE